jgi:hypothetical protein
MRINNNVAVSNSGFIFNSNTGESFSANPIGTDIINAIKESKSIEEIKTQIISKYEVDEETFEKDFYDFLVVLNNFSLTDPND